MFKTFNNFTDIINHCLNYVFNSVLFKFCCLSSIEFTNFYVEYGTFNEFHLYRNQCHISLKPNALHDMILRSLENMDNLLANKLFLVILLDYLQQTNSSALLKR